MRCLIVTLSLSLLLPSAMGTATSATMQWPSPVPLSAAIVRIKPRIAESGLAHDAHCLLFVVVLIVPLVVLCDRCKHDPYEYE